MWEFDWLLDHAVFCMSYTGSTATEPYEHLLELAGLTEDLKKHLHPSRARLRTTALLGLADLSDVLHDDDSDTGKARLTDLLASVETRLRSLQLTRPCVEKDDLEWLPDSEELRALAAVVAMLRLPETKSIRLLHILSGRCYETTAGSTTVSNKSEYARCRPPQLVGDAAVKEGRRRYSPQTDPAWGNWPKVWQPLLHWDLVTWQLAEWGLIRVERRFTPQDDLGVRIVSPTTAANAAARRMQQLTGSPWRPASS